jgi:hypothetical protein
MTYGRISLSCNLSLAPGFSPVMRLAQGFSRFNGFGHFPIQKRLKPFHATINPPHPAEAGC